jgi:multiple sugar transport system substrate-binding protein
MKRILIGILALCLMGTLFANGTQESPKQENVTVRMWTFVDPNATNGRSKALKQIISEFEAENPGVTVVVEPKVYGTMTAEFLAAAATGTAPDLMWCSSALLFNCISNGVLEPLENYTLKNWTPEEIADVDDAFFKFGEKDGKHYTLSLSKNAVCLYYRSDLLEAAGVSVPTTWDELYEAAKKLTDKEKGVYGFAFPLAKSGDYPIISNYIISKQGSLFHEDGTANFATQAGVDSINYLKKFYDEGLVPADTLSKDSEDMQLEFQSGRFAMMPLGFVRIGTNKAQASYDSTTIKVAPIPTGSWIDGWHVGIWSGSKHKEVAGKFLEKMYSPSSDLLWVELGAQAPVRKSTSKKVTITADNDYIEVAGKIFSTGYNVPNDRSYDGVKTYLLNAMQEVLVNHMDPLTALQNAEKEFNKTNNR